jgi:hypothetical protein
MATFAGLGLGLSVVSGLDTWLARRVLRIEHAKIGPERMRPFLLGLWAATVVAIARETRAGARGGVPRTTGIATDGRPSSNTIDPIGAKSSAVASAETDEFPTLGSS